MKRNWQPEELVEHWTLLPNELGLLIQRTDSNRLGFALLLKFFQSTGRFPQQRQEIPTSVVRYVAKQLNLSPSSYANYDWQGRTIKLHRAQIREFLGFREATVADALELTRWLEKKALAYELKLESLKNAALEHLRQLSIEPPTSERLERIVRSAVRHFEEHFFRSSAQKLSLTVRQRLDELLEKAQSDEAQDSSSDEDQSEESPATPEWASFKTDPGRLGLDSLAREAAKLQRSGRGCHRTTGWSRPRGSLSHRRRTDLEKSGTGIQIYRNSLP